MSTKAKSKPMIGPTAVPCVPGALPGGLIRTRFFDGMVLSQADLETEQRFWRMKRMLTNRALGDGVVWGLRLTWDDKRGVFKLGPGYALDCCGNDLVVECPAEIAARVLIERADPAVQAWCSGRAGPVTPCPDPAQGPGPLEACVVLQYVECPEAPQPVHADACAPAIAGCEPARVRETARLLLVPPPEPLPPGPIRALCDAIEDEPDQGEPTEPDIGVELDVRSDYDAITLIPGREETGSLGRVHETRNVDEPIRLHFSLDPRGDDFPFWIWESGQVLDVDGSIIDELTGPLDDLEWVLEVSVASLTPDNPRITNSFTYTAPDLTVASVLGDEEALFGGRRQTMMLVVSGQVVVELIQELDNSVELEYEVPQVSVSVQAIEETPLGPRSCLDMLTEHGLILDGDPVCTVKALIMTLLHGWLRSLVDDDTRTGERAIAEQIYKEAWRTLFGGGGGDGDGDEEQEAQLEAFKATMNKLFAELCQGLLYPGPRCRDEHHGVYLGCVELSQSGQVMRFDPWKHRRNVLTGPLLAHFGHQFGFAPLEEVMSRIAGMICCLSRQPVLQGQLQRNRPSVRRVPVGDAVLFYGRRGQPALSEAERASVVTTETVAWPAMLSSVTEALMRRRDSAGATGRLALISHPASGTHLLVPTADPAARPAGAPAEAVSVLVAPVVRELGPLARAPVSELAAGVAEAASVSELRALREGAAPARAIAAALRERRLASVSGLLDLGAEELFARAREADRAVDEEALAGVVEALFLDAEKLVVTAAEAAAKVARGRPPFVRRAANDDRVIAGLTAAVEKAEVLARPLLVETVKAIADRVAKAEQGSGRSPGTGSATPRGRSGEA